MESTGAKFCRLITSFSVARNLTKLKLEYLKSGFKDKKERSTAYIYDQNKSGFFGGPAFIQPIRAI